MIETTEFLKKITPSAKKGKLEPFALQILELRAEGCSFKQISEFLNQNGVQVSIAFLSRFVDKKLASGMVGSPKIAVAKNKTPLLEDLKPSQTAVPITETNTSSLPDIKAIINDNPNLDELAKLSKRKSQ